MSNRSPKSESPPGRIGRKLRQAIYLADAFVDGAWEPITLHRIALKAGVDYKTLWRFVNENADIRLSTVEQLCDFFGLGLGGLARPRVAKAVKT